MAKTKAELKMDVIDLVRQNEAMGDHIGALDVVVNAARQLLFDLDKVCKGCKFEAHMPGCQCHTALSAARLKRLILEMDGDGDQ